MTQDKNFKRIVRNRMANTGESYSVARAAELAKKKDWTATPAGDTAYRAARAEAQANANATGYDYGLERNDTFKTFHVFMLPEWKHRFGHELRCEVVSCELLDRCKPGHGPTQRGDL